MRKKGQLTIFFLLGVVIVIAGAFLAYLHQQPSAEAPAIVPVDSFAATEQQLHTCWQQAADHGVSEIGVYGGTLAPEILNETWFFRFGVTGGLNTVPSGPELETELSTGIGYFARVCDEDIAMRAAKYGITLTPGPLTVSSQVYSDTTTIHFEPDYMMSQGTTSKKVSAYDVHISTSLGKVVRLASYMASGYLSKGSLDILGVAAQGINVTVYSGPTSISAVVLSKDEQQGRTSAKWLLAFDQSGELPNYPPVVKPVASIIASPDQQKLGIVEASDPQGAELTYSTDSGMVNLDPSTGAFEVRATANEIGSHPVVFTVTNSQGASTSIATEVVVQ